MIVYLIIFNRKIFLDVLIEVVLVVIPVGLGFIADRFLLRGTLLPLLFRCGCPPIVFLLVF
jgi:hypothetical protein